MFVTPFAPPAPPRLPVAICVAGPFLLRGNSQIS
jgi:hypothetical protein